MTENDIKIAKRFNTKHYQFERSIGAIGFLAAGNVRVFNKAMILGIAQYQQRHHLRVDGQVGWYTLRHMAWRLIGNKAVYSDIGDAIWLVVDGLGLRVAKVKSIVYDPKQTANVKVLDDGVSIRLGTQALRSYNTFVNALKRGLYLVNKAKEKKAPIPLKDIPEKELLRLVDKYWQYIPAVYDPNKDSIGGFRYQFFVPRYRGRLVDKTTKSRLVEIKKSCKTWWDNNNRYIYSAKAKHRFHIIGKALVSIGCYDQKGKVFLEKPHPLEERKYGDIIIEFIRQNMIRDSVYCDTQAEIDAKKKRKKEREDRAQRIRRLHRDRLRGVYRGKEAALMKELQVYDAWSKSDKGMAAFDLASELQSRGYKGLRVPYKDWVSFFPMCCVAIRDKAGVIVLKPALYFNMPPLLQALLQKDRAKTPKRYIKYLLKRPHIGRVNSHMRVVLKWWAYGNTAPVQNAVPWDAYIDRDDVKPMTALKPIPLTWKRLGLRKYITDNLKKGHNDDYMVSRFVYLHKLVYTGIQRVQWAKDQGHPRRDQLSAWMKRQGQRGNTAYKAYWYAIRKF